MSESSRKIEFGDYQTPADLARECCRVLKALGFQPASILEPTCGVGGFLRAALDSFPDVQMAVGFDVNPAYAYEARKQISARDAMRVRVEEGNFFTLDWQSILFELADPLLVIGNPPWVTNSALGQIGGANLPPKRNIHKHAGLDALTGKSNFDISEAMLLRLMERLNGRIALLAMLCKTAVARKVLHSAWKKGLHIGEARLFQIDAQKHFGAAVDACFLVCPFLPQSAGKDCLVSCGLEKSHESMIGFRDGELIADVNLYQRWSHLGGISSYRWRSGIKHDCSKIMEFRKVDGEFRNGLSEVVKIEHTYLYPMLKSSDVANGATLCPTRWMLVPQSSVGGDTSRVEKVAPRTWDYLQTHRDYLERRASAIYVRRPAFSIFGIGDYSFAPWKVAISGFYKQLTFRVVGSIDRKPIMLDDTVYFLPCRSKPEADTLARMLNSEAAQSFFRAFVFWDAKRPITVSLLSQLSIERLAMGLGESAGLGLASFAKQFVLIES